MRSITRLGTFEDVLTAANPEVRAICLALRALIEELHPDVVEVPRPGEPSAAYGFGEKKMSEAYAYIMPQKEYVNLGFYHGATLAPTHPALEERARNCGTSSCAASKPCDLRKPCRPCSIPSPNAGAPSG